jgi:hypothetical protein
MAGMKSDKPLTDDEIDEIVIAQAYDDEFWEEPIQLSDPFSIDLTLSPELAKRAAFFAKLHDMPDTSAWLQQIIQERIHFEEAAFAGLKRVMENRAPYQTSSSE